MVLREVFRIETPWMAAYLIAMAVVLVVVSSIWSRLRPLRPYFVVMLAVLVLTTVADPLLRSLGVIPAGSIDEDASLVGLLGSRVLLALEALILIAIVAALGYRGRAAFMAVGDLHAPSGLRLPGATHRSIGWAVIGPIAALVLFALTASFVFTSVGSLDDLDAALPLLPVALLAAALNAFSENVLYRAGPLAPLVPVVGSGHAIWMLAIWFGLGHFYGGIPSGVAALLFVIPVGLVLAKAMVDTRGLAWSWGIHFCIDAAIYIALALSAVG
jgi:membrane protease YdiL (CAAX protease family)